MASSLASLLTAAAFFNTGTVTRNSTFLYQAIDCLYLEPENVTEARNVWANSNRFRVPQAGPCMYMFEFNGSVPLPPTCASQNVTPGFDRPGYDYRSTPAYASWQACEAACCADGVCAAWAWVPNAPSPFMGCTSTAAPCCYLKTGSPPPKPLPLPGLVSGARPAAPPIPLAPPPSGMRSAVPLGGLGAGTFELRADGTIHEWTVHEASPAGNAKLGTMGDALLGVRVAGGGVAGGAAARALRTGGVGSAASAAEGVDAITYSGSWPLARLAVADGALDAAAGGPLGLALFAYSRFVPGDVNASAAPSVTFTLRATNPSTTEPLNLSLFLSLPLSATNDCWGGSGEKTTVLPVPSWAACRAACAAAAATDCAAWWFDGLTATCTLDPGLFLVGYKAGATCGVRGAWAVAPLPRSGAPTLTLTQAPAPCAPGARNPSPWCGDYALAAGEGEAGAFAAGDSLADMWRAFAGNGTPGAPPQPGTAAGIGAVVATVTLPPGATGTATVVFAWWLPNRDFLGETVGAWYQNLFVSAGDAADAAAGAAAQVQAVADINAHHAVWAGSSEPDWLKDIAINSYSHSRNAFYMADGRWRQWEAFDCDDMDSVHNDYQRHLPYLWAFPALEAQKSAAWGASQDPSGFIKESLTTGCLAPPDALDHPGGRKMSDVTTVWTLHLWELYTSGALGGAEQAAKTVAAAWDTVKGALKWQLEQCGGADAPGLPAHLVCTYDIEVLEKYPTTTYNAFLHLAMMKAVSALAEVAGDAATGATAAAAFSTGLAAVKAQLWNGTAGAFRAFSEGPPGQPATDLPIMADCLYGVSIAQALGLGLLWDGSFSSHLAEEVRANGSPYGLTVLTGRPGAMPFADIDFTTWGMAGPTWSMVALASGAVADPDAALAQTRLFMDNARSRLRDQWNLAGLYSGASWEKYTLNDDGAPWCTNHYGIYVVHYGLSGQQANLPAGTLSFKSAYAPPYTVPLLLAGTTGAVSRVGGNITVSLAFGALSLPARGLVVDGAPCPTAVNLLKGESVSWTHAL